MGVLLRTEFETKLFSSRGIAAAVETRKDKGKEKEKCKSNVSGHSIRKSSGDIILRTAPFVDIPSYSPYCAVISSHNQSGISCIRI